MEFREYLKSIVGEDNLLCGAELKQYTTFRVGGPARYLVHPKTEAEILPVIMACKEAEVPFFLLGRGSNLLVSDKGFDGVVLRLPEHLDHYRIEGECVHAQAGANLMQVARECTLSGLTGFAFAAGIPGSIGGAVAMNAGAYDGEISKVITGATVLDPKTGVSSYYNREELKLSYRHSVILEQELIVLSADFRLQKGSEKESQAEIAKMEEYNRMRREKQPLQYPSAGSTFKRPQGAFAGKLIQDAGLAGMSIGDAAVSEKHCGFVINRGEATASEVYELCKIVRQTVSEKFGYDLELEVRLVGEFE